MKTTILELRQKRAKLIADARALNDKVQAEKRPFTQEEQNNWDALMDDADKLRATVEREERMLVAEADLGEPITAATRPATDGRDAGQKIEFRSRSMRNTNDSDQSWRDNPEWRRLLRTGDANYNAGFRAFLRTQPVSLEMRALQADLDTSGGNLMAPIQLVDRIIQAVDDAVYIRQWATVFAVPNADSLGIPTLENDPADADWDDRVGDRFRR
jgi:HK97 family phage major capsid protein